MDRVSTLQRVCGTAAEDGQTALDAQGHAARSLPQKERERERERKKERKEEEEEEEEEEKEEEGERACRPRLCFDSVSQREMEKNDMKIDLLQVLVLAFLLLIV